MVNHYQFKSFKKFIFIIIVYFNINLIMNFDLVF